MAETTSLVVSTTSLLVSTGISSAVLSTATAIGNATNGTAPHDPAADNGECKLLGPFAILVQGALGILALFSLVYKRWRERPQRPVKIWAFDVSKQVFGTLLLHLANLLMSLLSAGEIQAELAKAAANTIGVGDDKVGDPRNDPNWRPNPCSFYLLNLGIDTTIGIPILLLILKVLTVGASLTPLARPPESIKSGWYGNPPQVTWWLKQSVIYFLGLLGMKVCVFFIFQLCPWIVVVGDWALKWTEGNTALQIAFVMLIFPLLMNAFQYYIIDTFIKKKPELDETDAGVSQHGSEGERGGLLTAGDDDDEQRDSTEEDEVHKGVARVASTEFLSRDEDTTERDADHRSRRRSTEGSSSSGTVVVEDDASKDLAGQK